MRHKQQVIPRHPTLLEVCTIASDKRSHGCELGKMSLYRPKGRGVNKYEKPRCHGGHYHSRREEAIHCVMNIFLTQVLEK